MIILLQMSQILVFTVICSFGVLGGHSFVLQFNLYKFHLCKFFSVSESDNT